MREKRIAYGEKCKEMEWRLVTCLNNSSIQVNIHYFFLQANNGLSARDFNCVLCLSFNLEFTHICTYDVSYSRSCYVCWTSFCIVYIYFGLEDEQIMKWSLKLFVSLFLIHYLFHIPRSLVWSYHKRVL